MTVKAGVTALVLFVLLTFAALWTVIAADEAKWRAQIIREHCVRTTRTAYRMTHMFVGKILMPVTITLHVWACDSGEVLR